MSAITSEPVGYRPQGRQDYLKALATLSEASVHQHFQAFVDIDWENPDFEVRYDDERWILGEEDPLGSHPWYRSLSQERQIEIGIYRWAQICKVGLQFEQLLNAGIMNHGVHMGNNNPELRYATHEATEECHHIQMFQEFVNRTGANPPGAPAWFRNAIPFLATVGAWAPTFFWMGVLAGEEPIDYLQKELLRKNRNLHPMLERIISIHVAEEARHIGFAHQYLEQHVPGMNRLPRTLLALATPIGMRAIGDVIMRPCQEALDAMGIPDEVAREVWWEDPESGAFLRELYSDVRMLTEDLGLRGGRVTEALWRAMRIAGRPARFRSEPAPASS